jgi:hypothetical protein
VTERPEQPPRPEAACLLCPCRWHREQWQWRLADPNYRTCSPCSDRLALWLREIRDLFPQLDPSPTTGDGGRGAPGFRSSSPARDLIIALRDRRNSAVVNPGDVPDVVGEMGSWANIVREERRLTDRETATIETEVGLLLNHLTWITKQTWVDDFCDEVEVVRMFVRVGTDETDGKRPVGACPSCEHKLWAPLSGDTIRCSGCGRQWERREWLHLGRTLTP